MGRFFIGILLGLVIAGTIFAYFAVTQPQKITQATREVQMWRQKYEALKARVSQLLSDLGKAKKNGEEAKKQVEELRKENRRLREELDRLKKRLASESIKAASPKEGDKGKKGRGAAEQDKAPEKQPAED